MAHKDITLPHNISAGSSFAPVSIVHISRNTDGTEKRVARRSITRFRCDVGQSIRTLEDMYDIYALFQITNGPEHTFAIRNELDYKSCRPAATPAQDDILLGTGDGVTATYQLRKRFSLTDNAGSTENSGWRNIVLPVRNTVLVEVNGVLQTETTHYTVNYTTGVITFGGGSIPAVGHDVKAGFKFDLMVRFDTNDLSQVLEAWNSGSTPNIPLIEVVPT